MDWFWTLPCIVALMVPTLIAIGKMIDGHRSRRGDRVLPWSKTPPLTLKVKLKGGNFLANAITASMADVTRIIEREITLSACAPVRTGRLKSQIKYAAFYGTEATGTWAHRGLAGLADDDHFPQSGLGASGTTSRRLLPYLAVRPGTPNHVEVYRCQWCRRLNVSTSVMCAFCGGSQLLTELPIGVIPFVWSCPYCDRRNSTAPLQCVGCGAHRGE